MTKGAYNGAFLTKGEEMKVGSVVRVIGVDEEFDGNEYVVTEVNGEDHNVFSNSVIVDLKDGTEGLFFNNEVEVVNE